MPAPFQDGPEARSWLQANGQPAALASNRFDSTADALAFVEQLYTAGAQRVFIPGDSIRDDEIEMEAGGPYADALVIELASSEAPALLLELYFTEADHEGYDLRSEPPLIIEERYLYLWWD